MLIQLGIRRSGNHAISQWLFPMLKDFIFINGDYHINLLNSASLVKNGSFNILMSFENINLNVFNEYAEHKNSVLVVRNPLNMLASSWKIYTGDDRILRIKDAIKLYEDYQNFKGQVIIYDNWVVDKEYRKLVAKKLELKFDDSNFKNIWGYGGSSFEDKNYLNRFEMIEDKEFHAMIDKEKLLKQFEYYKSLAQC